MAKSRLLENLNCNRPYRYPIFFKFSNTSIVSQASHGFVSDSWPFLLSYNKELLDHSDCLI